MSVTISTRGQTVIPAEIRKKYGLGPHSKVEFIDTGKQIILVPLPSDPFKSSRGILKGLVSNKDLFELRRKERELERKKRK